MAIKLYGLDVSTGEVFSVDIKEEKSTFEDVKRLFRTALDEEIHAVAWECGVPGEDVAVVWKGTTFDCCEHYLHLSHSDGRVW
jgi:hypothetical protein